MKQLQNTKLILQLSCYLDLTESAYRCAPKAPANNQPLEQPLRHTSSPNPLTPPATNRATGGITTSRLEAETKPTRSNDMKLPDNHSLKIKP